MSTAPSSRAPHPASAPAVLVASELELVERRIEQLLQSREPLLTEISRYLIDAGGKRVRPAVTLLVFRACGGEALDDIVDVAVALELIHSASLLHDDIIDGSHVRRGRDSARLRYGIADTLVTGDFLFSRAFQICGRFDEQLIHWAAEACIALTEGEVMQARFRRNPQVRYAEYEAIITRKTASLFEQGARTAAHLAQAPPHLVDAMARCGTHVGLAFQMVDDLLDVTAVEGELGKPVGLDLREGNPSLPIVLALPGDPGLRRVFADREPDEAEVRAALRRLRGSAVIRDGYRLASAHAERAREALELLPNSVYRDSLLHLVDQLVERGS